MVTAKFAPALQREAVGFVVSSARACDDPIIKAEKAHAAHKRAIVVCLPLIDPPNIKRGRKPPPVRH